MKTAGFWRKHSNDIDEKEAKEYFKCEKSRLVGINVLGRGTMRKL